MRRPSLIRELKALRVFPDEVLIVRIPGKPCEIYPAEAAEISAALIEVGLGDRSIVFLGDVEFAVASRDPSTEGEPR